MRRPPFSAWGRGYPWKRLYDSCAFGALCMKHANPNPARRCAEYPLRPMTEAGTAGNGTAGHGTARVSFHGAEWGAVQGTSKSTKQTGDPRISCIFKRTKPCKLHNEADKARPVDTAAIQSDCAIRPKVTRYRYI